MLPIHQFGSFDRKIKLGRNHSFGNRAMVYSLNFVIPIPIGDGH